jgi:hypothetical protein
MSESEHTESAGLGSEFVFPIDPSTHLFFDDQQGNIDDVENMTDDNELNLFSVWCLSTYMTLYIPGDKPQYFDCEKQKDKYHEIKRTDAPLVFVPGSTHKIHEIGTGITTDIIQQIIANEPKRTGLYFFDFDMLLSQFGGLKFPENPESVTEEWLEQYAKYLFSDYIGAEPENGRLNLLKRMFQVIGPDRIYIITANPYASTTYALSSGRNVTWYFEIFVRLLQVLLPSFIPTHLVYANTKVQSKSTKIMQILESRPKGGARLKTRKTKRTKSKARKTRSKARRTKRTKSKAKTSRRSRCSRKKTSRVS